ncbi:MAG: hypothetical protein FWH55_09200 [Oscillospiraceae bacterium]|nr:hypothetical protein [Oscillospiraceae bacterium]
MVRGLLEKIISLGSQGAIVPFSRIDNLKNDMIALKNGEYHTDWLNRMVNHITDDANIFVPSDISFEPRSLISVVIPSPKVHLQLNHQGKMIPCVVPPVISNLYLLEANMLKQMEEYLTPLGLSIIKAPTLPQKL